MYHSPNQVLTYYIYIFHLLNNVYMQKRLQIFYRNSKNSNSLIFTLHTILKTKIESYVKQTYPNNFSEIEIFKSYNKIKIKRFHMISTLSTVQRCSLQVEGEDFQ